jgi:hypothetical protein
MAKITVYHYELQDPFSGISMRSRHPATRRAIDAAGGILLQETAQEVDLQWVTDDGIVEEWPIPEGEHGTRVVDGSQWK